MFFAILQYFNNIILQLIRNLAVLFEQFSRAIFERPT